MKVVILSIALVGSAGVAALANSVPASAPATAQVVPSKIDPQSLSLHPAIHHPHLTQAEATAAAQGSAWGALLRRGTGVSVRFGTFADGLGHKIGGTVQNDAPNEVWAITAGGYNFASSGPYIPGVAVQPATGYAHFLTVYVNDQSGAVVMARESN
jgi:hypothetical protein